MRLVKRLFPAAVALIMIFLLTSTALAAKVTGSSDPTSVVDDSQEHDVTLKLDVTNDSSAAMENISISNNNGVVFDTSGVSIAAGSSYTFSKRVRMPYALLGAALKFDIKWSENGESKSASASITVLKGAAATPGASGTDALSPSFSTAQLSVSRTVSAEKATQGDVITITYTIKNQGATDIANVTLTDKEINRNPLQTGITVPAMQSYTYTHEYTMGTATIKSVPVVTYIDASGAETTVTTAEKVIGMVNTKLTIEVQAGTPNSEGVPFTLFLTNDGNQRVSKLKIADELGNVIENDLVLAIGENRAVSCTIPNTQPRNVVFYFTGVDATGSAYADNTQSYPVRQYIDPALLGMELSAAVVEPLNAGSIKLSFTIANTGSLAMSDLVLSEEQYGEIKRLDTFEPGTQTVDVSIGVDAPRDLVFTLSALDPAGSPFEYKAYITADYVGVTDKASEPQLPATQPSGAEQVDKDIEEVGSVISDTLRTALIVLGILTVLAFIALIVLGRLEREERRRIAKRRAARERVAREQAQATSRALTDNERAKLRLEEGVQRPAAQQRPSAQAGERMPQAQGRTPQVRRQTQAGERPELDAQARRRAVSDADTMINRTRARAPRPTNDVSGDTHVRGNTNMGQKRPSVADETPTVLRYTGRDGNPPQA